MKFEIIANVFGYISFILIIVFSSLLQFLLVYLFSYAVMLKIIVRITKNNRLKSVDSKFREIVFLFVFSLITTSFQFFFSLMFGKESLKLICITTSAALFFSLIMIFFERLTSINDDD